ncbi:hypothetical protein KJ758_00665, partial [Patescibacteria group bacterium]|nr:hypothetical protein [Patescibacteria group bacterium]
MAFSSVFGLFYHHFTMAASITWDGNTDLDGGDGVNWSDPLNWSTNTVPGAADIAVFDATYTGDSTIDASFAGTVDGIDINAGYTGTITVARSLIVETGDFAQADGIFDCGSQTITFTSAVFTITGGTFTEGTSTVIFTGSSQNFDVNVTEAFYNVTIDKTDLNILTIASGDTMVVTNDLYLTDGKIITGTIDARKNIVQHADFDGGNATLDFGDDAVAQTYNIAGGRVPVIEFDSSADASDEVVLTADAEFTGLSITADFGANAVPITYNGYNLTISTSDFTQAAGTFTAPSVLTLDGADFIKTGGTFVEGLNSVVFTGGGSAFNVDTTETFYNVTIDKNTAASVVISSGDTMVVTNDLYLTDGFVTLGTVDARKNIVQHADFDGGSATLDFGDDGLAQTYNIAGGRALAIEFDSSADASDEVVLTADAEFTGLSITADFGANAVPITYNGYNLTISTTDFTQAAGTFTAPSVLTLDGADFIKTGGTFVEGVNSVVFTGGGSAFNVDTTETFYNVTIDKNTAGSVTISSGDTMVVTNNLYLTDGLTSIGDFAVQGNVVVHPDWDGGSAKLNFTGSNTQTFDLTGATDKYNGDIFTNKSGGQVNLSSDLTMDANNQDFIIEEGTFDLNSHHLSVTAGATETLIVETGGNLQLQGDETITGDSASYPQLDSGSTVTYDGVGSYTIKDYTYSNIATNGSGTYSMGVAEAIDSLTITQGTFDVTTSNHALTVSNDFSNSGTFNARAGTVTFDDVAQTSTISGSTSFYNFQVTTPSKNLEFAAISTQSVTGDLTMTGGSGTEIILRSTVTDTQWNINLSGTQDVTYVDVKDSNATGTTIDAGVTSINSLNNTNWTFGASNTAPTAASVTASQVTDGSGEVDISFIADDADLDDTLEALIEYNIGGGWTKATLSEV